jgi:hypothetical protein
MLSGIYCIEQIETGKKYIGKSKNLKKRMFAKHGFCHALNSALNPPQRDNSGSTPECSTRTG